MSRALKELRSLAPWNWDSRVAKHPPGEKALRDFEKVSYESAYPEAECTGAPVEILTGQRPAGSKSARTPPAKRDQDRQTWAILTMLTLWSG